MKTELEYLELLNNLAEVDCSSLYGIDDKRNELHLKILKEHDVSECYEKSKLIFEHLDKAIDFMPPLMPTDGISKYARELGRLLDCSECKFFFEGKITILHTKYGVLNETKWVNS